MTGPGRATASCSRGWGGVLTTCALKHQAYLRLHLVPQIVGCAVPRALEQGHDGVLMCAAVDDEAHLNDEQQHHQRAILDASARTDAKRRDTAGYSGRVRVALEKPGRAARGR